MTRVPEGQQGHPDAARSDGGSTPTGTHSAHLPPTLQYPASEPGHAGPRSTDLPTPHEVPWNPDDVEPVAATGGPGNGQRPDLSAAPRIRDRLLWAWPVCTVAALSIAGAAFGPYGTTLAMLVLVPTLVLYVGDEAMSQRSRLALATAALVLIAVTVVGHLTGLAHLSRPSHTRLVQGGGNSPPGTVDLRGRRASAKDLKGRNLRHALLSGATLDGVDLRGVDLRGATANGASFRGALLEGANLEDTDLRGADLHDACMYQANLTGARLAGADATGADVTSVIVTATQTAAAAVWPRPGLRPSTCH